MSLIVISSERFAEHQTPPGHPECPERAEVMDVVASEWRRRGGEVVAPRDATQHIFECNPDVLYLSTHQYPYYPGTGAADEIGRDRGAGFTVNVPLDAGAVDEDYRVVFQSVVRPVLTQFNPDVILVSAGFDAHDRDPLGGMRLTTQAFAAMTAELRLIAEERCDGRLVAVTEGGYDFRALADSLLAIVDVLASESAQPAAWPAPTAVAPARGRASAEAVTRLLRGRWRV